MKNSRTIGSYGSFFKKLGFFLLAMLLGMAIILGAMVGAVFALLDWVTVERLGKWGVDVSAADTVLTEQSPLRTMTILECYDAVLAISQNTATVTINSLIRDYGVIMSDDVRASLPPALLDLPLSGYTGDAAADNILKSITMGYVFEQAGAGTFPPAATAKMSDRTLDLLANEQYDLLFADVYLGDVTGVALTVDADGTVRPALAEGETATLMQHLGTIDLGEYFGAEDQDAVLQRCLSGVPVVDLMENAEESVFYHSLSGKMLGQILTVVNGGIAMNLDAITEDMYLGDVLGYHPVYADDGVTVVSWTETVNGTEVPVKGAYRTIVGVKVSALSDGSVDLMEEMNDAYLGELMGYDNLAPEGAEAPIFAKADENGSYDANGDGVYDSVPDELMSAFAEMTFGELKEDGALTEKVKTVRVGAAMGYTERDGVWYQGDEPVKGALRALAGYPVGEMDTAIDTLAVSDALGYVQNADGVYVNEETGKPASGIFRVLMTSTLDTLTEDANAVYFGEIMGYEKYDLATGGEFVEGKTTLVGFRKPDGAGGYLEPSGAVGEFVDLTVADMEDESTITKRINEMQIGTAMSYIYVPSDDQTLVDDPEAGVYYGTWYKTYSDDDDPTNDVPVDNKLLLSIIHERVESMDSVLSELTIAEVMGYKRQGDIWYTDDTYAVAVSGYMKLIGPETKVNEIDTRLDVMKQTANIGQYLDAGVLTLETEDQGTLDRYFAYLHTNGLVTDKDWRNYTLDTFITSIISGLAGLLPPET